MSFIAYESIFLQGCSKSSLQQSRGEKHNERHRLHRKPKYEHAAARGAGRCHSLSMFHATFWSNVRRDTMPVWKTSQMSREGVAVLPPSFLCLDPG
jgi:hypothetical protein